MRSGPLFPRGEWVNSPLRLFEGDRVQAQDEDGDWLAGTLEVLGGGLEVEYEEPRSIGGCVESSRLLGRDEAFRLRSLIRPEPLWSDEVRVKREDQIWRAAHPSAPERAARWLRELVGRDAVAAEPLLRRHLGRRVIVEVRHDSRTIHASGLLLAYDAHFIAMADTVLPAETALPLCPGRTVGADLEILWNDEGLELFNRGESTVSILGLRTSDGLRPWEITLKPGWRERTSFRRAPAGTAELVFESPVHGDAVLSRTGVRVRGGSEGSVSLPALPDLDTLVGDLPEAEETAPAPAARVFAPAERATPLWTDVASDADDVPEDFLEAPEPPEEDDAPVLILEMEEKRE